MAAPTYSATTIANSPVDHTAANTGTTRTTPSYSPASGTILVGAAASEDTSSCPIVSISGGPTWAQQYLNNSASKSSAALYTATAAGGSITSLVTATNGSIAKKFGLAVLQFTGSDGVGAKNTASGTTGFPSVSLTTTQDNSAIVAIVSDWSAISGTSTFSNISSSTPVEVLDYADGATYGFHVAYWPDVGAAGAKTVAMSAPSGQNWIIQAIEVKGTSGGAISGTATTGQGSQSASASGSVLISGTATAGQGSQSAAVSASEKIAGTATTGQGSQSVSATGGGASITGTATTAQGSQSAAVAGAERIAGTATTGQGSQSVAASTLVITGTATCSQGTQSSTAAGTESISGSATTSQKSQSVLVAVEVRPAVDLLWDAPSGWTPDGYRVKWGTSSGNYTQTADVGAGVLTLTIWGLTANTTYYWVVVGLSGTEEQTLSSESTFHTFPASGVTAQGSQSVAASGSVRITGTATTGQGSESSAVSGAQTISGTGATSQKSQSVLASTLVITGTATTGQGSQNVAGVGGGAAIAGPVVTSQGQSATASGTVTISGTCSSGQAQTVSATGTETIAGTATTGQGSQNVSGVGAGAAISGPVTTGQVQSVTAAGYVLITGVATTGQGLQSASGSGSAPPVTGTATTSQKSQSALSTGSVVISGALSTGQGSQRVNASGTQSIAGAVTTSQAQSASGSGSLQISGSGTTAQGSQSIKAGISAYREFDIVTEDGKYHIYSITYVELLTP